MMVLFSSALLLLSACAASATAPLPIDTSDTSGRTFDGLGGLSGGGATSVLLPDYPEKERSEILDFLFKPNFGASLHMLKVEIGGDSQSTDGTESSHMHSPDDLDYTRGYEWWLLQEAKKRNPEIKTYGLPWAFPGWVGGPEQSGSPFTHPNLTSTYILKWLEGARDVYDVDVDYIGIWNERASDAEYAKALRKTLDGAGFRNTRLVAKDGDKSICDDMAKDAEYAAAIDIVGLHYPSDFDNYSVCQSLNKPIWASEESSSYDDLNGAACWGRVVTSHYVLNQMTASIMWNLVGSYMHGTNWYASSLLTAVQPWSGYYEKDMPVVWATAHITQFTKPGWRYLGTGAGTGELEQGGYYASFVSPDSDAGSDSEYTLNVVKISRDHAPCTRPGLPDFDTADESVTFQFKTVPSKTLQVWYSNFEAETPILFEHQGTVDVAPDGTFTLNVTVGSMYTVSTVATATKGSFRETTAENTPAFPLPYTESFEGYPLSSEAKYWADQIGAFEIHNSTLDTVPNMVLRQMVPEKPIGWSDHGSNGPVTLIGMREFQDVTATVRFALPVGFPANTSVCIGNRLDQMWNDGIAFCVSPNGNYVLSVGGPKLGGNYDPASVIQKGVISPKGNFPTPNEWHTLELTTVGTQATGLLDDTPVFSNVAIRDIDTGFTGIGMSDWEPVQFDDFSLVFAGGAGTTEVERGQKSMWQNFEKGAPIGVTDCETNGKIDPAQQFELRANSWQLYHVASGMCAEASNDAIGASLSLQPCVFNKKEQQFRNDYTNIRNNNVWVSLGAYDAKSKETLVLSGTGPDSNVTLKKGFPKSQSPGWDTWSYFPNSQQLRNQYNSDPQLGYPSCLSIKGKE
jgi:galactosylceramidase